jgi:hypothetical protein
MTKIIGLTGLAGSGKDTVAKILVREHNFAGVAFADPIRAMLGALLFRVGADGSWMTDRELKERPTPVVGVSYRELAQTLGTEWGRAINPDFWVNIAGDRIERLIGAGCSIVISDVRFPNEVEWIRARGGEVWHIAREQVDPVREHVSEEHIAELPCDLVIDNSGTLEELAAHVNAALLPGEAAEIEVSSVI